MKTIGVSEARRSFSALLKEVEEGGDVIITRWGRPLARLVAAELDPAARLLEARTGLCAGLPIADLRKAGRR